MFLPIQWQLLRNGQYWSLRNLDTGAFLGVESSTAGENANVVATSHAEAWDLRAVEDNTNKYQYVPALFCVPLYSRRLSTKF